VVAEDSEQSRATTALIEVLRAGGDSDGAWTFANRAWRGSAEAEPRIGLAELAFETGRMEEALHLASALEHDDLVGERAVTVEGAALLALGRRAEARRVLEPLVPAASASLPWIEAIAATEGLPAALAAADRLPVRQHRAWVDVNARRAVWQARLGHRENAERWLAEVETVDALRGALTRAEMALAAGRPIDAEVTLRKVLSTEPREVRALDGLSTALAEQGRWSEALAVLSELRTRRPSELRWAIREAEWRYRQSPSPETLQALEQVVADHEGPDGASALARAYFAAGQFAGAVATLDASPSLADYDRVLLARSLRSLGRTVDALTALSGQGPAAPLDALLLRAELEAAVNGPLAADRRFRDLIARPDAEADWFLAWADLQTTSADLGRVLGDGALRFPAHAAIQERFAIAAWARGDREVAARAARMALATDPSRTSAWFVAIEVAGTARDRDTSLPVLLDRFEAQFGPDAEARVGVAEMLAGLSRSPEDPAARRALAWMEDVLARGADAAPAAVARTRLLLAQGRTAQALSAVDAIIAGHPELPSALKLRAELLGASGRYAEAVGAYDRYLTVAPDDFVARRQQARVEGWRGAYAASRERYAELREREPQADVVAAEADAKQSYYGGRWGEAASRYDRWLALDPKDVEAQLERAQLYDRLGHTGDAVESLRTVTSAARPNDVAAAAAERIDRRRRASVDLFASANSADAAARQQLLDLVDGGAGVSDDLGLGYGVRGRLFGGPSFAQGADDRWYGSHIGTQMSAALAPSLRASGSLAYRQLEGIEGAWFGDLGVAWRIGSRLRASLGAERALVLENQSTLTSGLHGIGPTAAVRWTPNTDFMLAASGGQLSLSDGNERRTFRASVSERVLRGVHELRLVGIVDGLGFDESRPTYFSPSAFWRFDAGTEWRGWLAMPRFFGDRERWLSAGYFFGVDDRSVRYHTMRAGVSYELAGGVAVVADAQATRSSVYNAGRVSVGLRLRQVAIPEP
jgi:tetratricopeptide (TPR) repeat protein